MHAFIQEVLERVFALLFIFQDKFFALYLDTELAIL